MIAELVSSSAGSHLNAVVRKCTAQHLANLVEKVGAARLLSGAKDLTDRILTAVIKLAQDSSQEARYVEISTVDSSILCFNTSTACLYLLEW